MKCSSDLGERDKAAGMVHLDLSYDPSLSPDTHGWYQARYPWYPSSSSKHIRSAVASSLLPEPHFGTASSLHVFMPFTHILSLLMLSLA